MPRTDTTAVVRSHLETADAAVNEIEDIAVDLMNVGGDRTREQVERGLKELFFQKELARLSLRLAIHHLRREVPSK